MQTKATKEAMVRRLKIYAMSGVALQAMLSGSVVADQYQNAKTYLAQAAAQKKIFNISRQPLPSALLRLSEQGDIIVAAPAEITAGKMAPAITGAMLPMQALEQLLSGTGLSYRQGPKGDVTIYVSEAGTGKRDDEPDAGSGDEVSFVLEEIVVTAQRREQSLMEVPFSLVALGDSELKKRGIMDYEALGLSVPGLTVEDNGFTKRFYIRGIGNEAGSASTVAIYLDEAPLTVGRQALQLDAPIYDIERVEVLRGPQGTLFGQGAMGGAIRFVSKSPQLDSFAAAVDAAASVTKGGAPSQQVQAMVNVPIADQKLAIRVAANFEHDGGWVDHPLAQKKDFNSTDTTNVRTKMLWHPSDEFDVEAMVILQRRDAGQGKGEDENGNFVPILGQATIPTTTAYYDLYHLAVSYNLGFAELLSATSYLDSKNDTQESGNSCCGGNEFIYRPGFGTDNKVFSQELRLSSTGETDLYWVFGGFFQALDSDSQFSYFYGAPLPAGSALTSSYGPFAGGSSLFSDSWSVFADVSYKLTEKLEIGLGGRYFKDKRKFIDDGFIYAGTVLSGETRQSATFSAFSPRGYIRYSVSDDMSVYANVGKGFRSGGFNVVGRPAYNPEKVWSYDVGVRSEMFEGQLTADAAFFLSRYSDYITYVVDVGGLSYNFNAGELEIKGAEWTLSWNISETLSLGTSGSYIHSEFIKVPAGSAISVGQSGPYVPEIEWGGWFEYQFYFLNREAILRTDYTHRGQVFATDVTQPSDVIDMLNVNIDWQWSDTLSIGLFGRNLLNERGFISPFGHIYRFSARARPREFGVRFGATF